MIRTMLGSAILMVAVFGLALASAGFDFPVEVQMVAAVLGAAVGIGLEWLTRAAS